MQGIFLNKRAANCAHSFVHAVGASHVTAVRSSSLKTNDYHNLSTVNSKASPAV